MATKGNNVLWCFNVIFNILIILIGVGLFICSIILLTKSKKPFSMSIILIVIGGIVIFSSILIVCAGSTSGKVLLVMNILQGLLALVFIIFSVVLTIDSNSFLNWLVDKDISSREEYEYLKNFLNDNLKFTEIAGYSICAAL